MGHNTTMKKIICKTCKTENNPKREKCAKCGAALRDKPQRTNELNSR